MGLFHPIGRINPMSRINPTMLRQIESVPALAAFIPSLVDCFPSPSAQADPATGRARIREDEMLSKIQPRTRHYAQTK